MAIATTNPATGEVIQTFEALTSKEIEQKLQLAVRTFRAELNTPFAERARRMMKAAEILDRDEEKFAHLMTLEMGKPYKAAIAEAMKSAGGCRYYAENAERFLSDEVIDTGKQKSFVRYRPIGPILAVGPLAAALISAVGGAAAAGVAGALIGWGIPEEDAKYYEGEVKAGRFLVTVDATGRKDDPYGVFTKHGGYNRASAPRP